MNEEELRKVGNIAESSATTLCHQALEDQISPAVD